MQKTTQPRRQKPSSHLWIFGRHACFSALNNPVRKIHQVLVTKSAKEDFLSLTLPKNLSLPTPRFVDNHSLDSILGPNIVHQGIALEVSPLEEYSLEKACKDGAERSLILVLDQVTDIQNIGAILRSSAAFGVKALVLTEYHSPPETGAMAKAASGALEITPIIRATNLVQALETLKQNGYWCVGLDGEAKQPLTALHKFEKLALVMGAEGKGLRRLTQKHCDLLVKIPIHSAMESLNVSNAAAIALYEANRSLEV